MTALASESYLTRVLATVPSVMAMTVSDALAASKNSWCVEPKQANLENSQMTM